MSDPIDLEHARRRLRPDSPRDPVELPRISRRAFWSIFALALGIFLFGHGPIWRHVWTMSDINDAILWSYLPIPVLVAASLVAQRRLSGRAFFLDTLDLTLLKYSVTFGLALVLWTVTDPPASAHPAPVVHAPAPPDTSDAPVATTPIDRAHAGDVHGVVTDARGEPVEGALVYVSGGVDGLVFAPPRATVALENRGEAGGLTPKVAAAMVGEPVTARSADGRLHTLVASAEGGTVFNVPLLPSGAPRPVDVREAHGLMELRCTVHADEAHATLAMLSHPFFGLTDAAGRYRFDGLPEGDIRVAVTRGRPCGRSSCAPHAELEVAAHVAAREDTNVALRLPP